MRITYLFDPLCGWCYGADPTLEKLAQLDDVTLALMPTGLFAGEGARAMDAQFAAYAWQNDQRIARLTGQPFSERYRSEVLGKSGGMFDSAPATLGMIAVRATEPARELEALKAIQRARYVDAQDIASLAGISNILRSIGLPAAAERVRAQDSELMQTYRREIQAAQFEMQRFGISGVPAVLVGDGAERHLLPGNLLFGRFDLLISQLKVA
ncbi:MULTISPECIES: DsbA family protein [unclassified Bradyrhizobium]|uniref:DsbA family protein n=1 Tax=unclassified Bradyrhizobium TaxID=2631580 RepID=UPI001FFA82E5|nr:MULTISPECIES: DsbA family protein [unclassified Bradyrhizobium]MCK1709161.1 DsbA family protein [Bradyrhizobium sp. 143]MCK1729032.1 DsbA family protein [Bradyrhizobium sp. 142]